MMASFVTSVIKMTTLYRRGLKARGHTRFSEDLKVLLEHMKYNIVAYKIYVREKRVRNS